MQVANEIVAHPPKNTRSARRFADDRFCGPINPRRRDKSRLNEEVDCNCRRSVGIRRALRRSESYLHNFDQPQQPSNGELQKQALALVTGRHLVTVKEFLWGWRNTFVISRNPVRCDLMLVLL